MRRGSRLAASGLALGVLLVSATASGYCRTTTCDPRRQACPRDAQGCMTGGIPLAWPEACVGFSVQRDGSVKLGIDAGTLRGIVTDAFATWQAAACAPTIAWSPLEDASCAEVQYNSQAPNANLWLFRDEVWPYDDGGKTLALTTVTYNLKTGAIYDADVELNAAQNLLVARDPRGPREVDLRSIVTHEAGHVLGLAHSGEPDAVMNERYRSGTTSLRELTADDVSGVCAIYPADRPLGVCRPVPRHGFSPSCATEAPLEEGGCCSVAPGRRRGSEALALAALLGGALLAATRRRARRA